MWANSVLADQPIPKHNLNYSCNRASSKHRDTILHHPSLSHPVFSHFDSPLYLSAKLETSSLLSRWYILPFDRERRNKRATRKTREPVPLFAREQISEMARSSSERERLEAELRPRHTPAKGTPCPHACIDECIGKRGPGYFHRSSLVTGQIVQISRGRYLERERPSVARRQTRFSTRQSPTPMTIGDVEFVKRCCCPPIH